MTPRRTAKVYRGTARNLALLARQLQAGELVAVPTETVYGLAGNALDARACAKIFTAKGRPTQDPLIVHVHAVDQLTALCKPNAEALKLARAFWPGPLTLVLPKKPVVPDIVTAGRDSVAVRMPSHPLFRRLLKLAGLPLAAPSANPFGYISPTTAAHVRDSLGKKISHILDGGSAEIGLESTIVDLRDPSRPVMLRPGAITAAQIERVLGREVHRHRAKPKGGKGAGLVAPGMLARHYSPRTPVMLHDTLTADAISAPNMAAVFLRKPGGKRRANTFWFDDRGRLAGVARRLFAVLRELDQRGYRAIHVELAPAEGLGEAINDRLRRAAAR